jgi:heptosyltransferase-3
VRIFIASKSNRDFDVSRNANQIGRALASRGDRMIAIWQTLLVKVASSASDPVKAKRGRHQRGFFAWPRLSSANSKKFAERIVVFRLGSLGDTIVALPCLHKVADAFPNAERFVLTNIPVSTKAAAIEAILANSKLIDGVIEYPVRLRSIKQLWTLRQRLKRLGASTLIYLAPVRGLAEIYRDIVFFRLCGFKRIIGAPYTLDLCRNRVDGVTGFEEQECIRLTRTLVDLGTIDLDNQANWDLRLTDQERENAGTLLAAFNERPFIAINMGGKFAQNHWGNENWRRLFIELASTHGAYGLLIVGAAEDAGCVAEVTQSWPSPIVNACGRLAPRESAAALEKAMLFIGHDSGPMHLAAACGVTCVALLSGLNQPRKWHPYGAGHRVIHRMEGMTAISVHEVTAAVREALTASVEAAIKS